MVGYENRVGYLAEPLLRRWLPGGLCLWNSHQLTQQRHCTLMDILPAAIEAAVAHQTICRIERGAAFFVFYIQLRAMLHQEFDHLIPALLRRAMQCLSP